MENQILLLLQGSPGTRFSYKEIGRIVDRRQYREDCHWARPFLERLVCEGSLSKEDALYFFAADEVYEENELTPCTRGGPLKTHELTVDPHEKLEVIGRFEP